MWIGRLINYLVCQRTPIFITVMNGSHYYLAIVDSRKRELWRWLSYITMPPHSHMMTQTLLGSFGGFTVLVWFVSSVPVLLVEAPLLPLISSSFSLPEDTTKLFDNMDGYNFARNPLYVWSHEIRLILTIPYPCTYAQQIQTCLLLGGKIPIYFLNWGKEF